MSLRNIEERLSRLERAVTVSPDSVLLTAGLENGSDALLSVKEAAARMGLSAATIYRLVGNGQLKALRIGTGRGAVRIRPDALHDYVARGNCKQHDGSSDRRRSTLRLKHLKVRR